MLKNIFLSSLPFFILVLFSVLGCLFGYWIFIGLDGSLTLSKTISKITQLMLILSIYPIMRWLNLSTANMGLVPFKAFLQQILAGIALGVVTLLPVLLLSYFLGITVLDESRNWSLDSLLMSLIFALLLGVLISLLEEPMFRGILIAAYVRRIGVTATIFVSAFYYAILHFIKAKTTISIEQASLTDSFKLLLEAFQQLLNPEHLGAFWALLMVGIFLAIMRTRMQLSLAWCIGCHAAWVWQIKMAHKITSVNESSDLLFLVSPYDGVIGPMVAIWLSLAIGVYFIYERGLKGRG